MKQNRYVRRTFDQYDDDFPPSDATACVAWFVAVLNDIPEPYRSAAKIEIKAGGLDYGRIEVSYTRPETDEEEAEREAAELAKAEERRAAELRQLAALMDKYGPLVNEPPSPL
jgi:hypothetical protein